MSTPARPSPWQIYRRLLAWSRRYWPMLSIALVGMVVEAGAAGAFTAMMEPIIDDTFVAREGPPDWTLPLAIVGLFVLRGIATFVTDYGMANSGRSVVRDLRQALQDAEMRKRFAASAIEVIGSTPEEFGRYASGEIKRWGEVARAANIQLD